MEDLFSYGRSVASILEYQDLFGNLVTRGAVEPGFPGVPGRMTRIDQRFFYFGEVKIEADVDFMTLARLPLYSAAVVDFHRAVFGSDRERVDEEPPHSFFVLEWVHAKPFGVFHVSR